MKIPSRINIQCLASGSIANSYAVELPAGELVAVECGISPIDFYKKIGKNPDFYWLSHGHSDHSRFEKLYKRGCQRFSGFSEFSLEHGTMQKPCENKGFYLDHENDRLLFATDFYDFEKVKVEKMIDGVAMVECSHDYPTYKRFANSENPEFIIKAKQWENHACEHQTVEILRHFFSPNFIGKIILLHRSPAAIATRGYSEVYIKTKFPYADISWA